ncbi:PspC domain-containing protein [Candidatus Wolfebacteria bacterium]|nr:PspC domain-containing protein [Candidatus Wolfebacteria bacterium]
MEGWPSPPQAAKCVRTSSRIQHILFIWIFFVGHVNIKKMKQINKKLRIIPEEGWLGGVCAGFAYYLGLPIWIVRMLWVLLSFWMGWGIILYILFWIFIPETEKTPEDYHKITD